MYQLCLFSRYAQEHKEGDSANHTYKEDKKVFGEFLSRASMYRPRPINSGISRRILISLHGIANFELVREVVRMCAHTSSTM